MNDPAYNYLVVIHIPFAREKDGSVRTGDMWVKDLRGMAAHLGRITVAAPVLPPEQITPILTGSFALATIPLDDPQLQFLPLPRYYSAATFLRSVFKARRLLRLYVKAARFVHIDTGGWPLPPGQLAFPFTQRENKKTVVFIGDGGDPIGSFQDKIKRDRSWFKKLGTRLLMASFGRFCRRAAKQADLVFFHNPVTQQCFQSFARNHYTFLRTFVDRDIILTKSKADEKLKFMRQEGPLRLMMVGRLHAIKGVTDAIEAVRRARRRGADIELTIVGTGPEESKLCKQVHDKSLDGAITFRGVVKYGELLFALMREHHGVVICNLTLELSRNVLLAMALGAFVLTYSNRALETLIIHRRNGYVCELGSVTALTDAMVDLAADRRLGRELVRQGLETVKQHTFEACHARRAELIRLHLPGSWPEEAV